MLRLFSDFLFNRQQRVLWNNCYSPWSVIPSGVPQGSVLGPLLFTLVVNDLKPLFSNSCIIKYADDVSLLHFVRSSSDDHLQEEFDKCMRWSRCNYLPLNFSKCQVLDFCTKKCLSLTPVFFSGSPLPQVETAKILGVFLSSDLSWNAHISYIVSKASHRVFIIRNLKGRLVLQNLFFVLTLLLFGPFYFTLSLRFVIDPRIFISNGTSILSPPHFSIHKSSAFLL